MFTNFHHASYLVPVLDDAIRSYAETFGGQETGRGMVAGLGEVGFVQVGEVEVEFIQPETQASFKAKRCQYYIMWLTRLKIWTG